MRQEVLIVVRNFGVRLTNVLASSPCLVLRSKVGTFRAADVLEHEPKFLRASSRLLCLNLVGCRIL